MSNNAVTTKTAVEPSPQLVLARRARLRVLVTIMLIVLLIGAVLFSIAVGQYAMSPAEIWQVIKGAVGGETSSRSSRVLLQIRAPRVALSLLVGAALGMAGALLQALFANPLADPGVIGVSSGAALGAAVALAIGWAPFGEATVAIAAIVAGLATTLTLYRLARGPRGVRTLSLLLMGIAVNALAGAGISIAVFFSSSATRDQIVFWQMGSLNGTMWPSVVVVAVLVALGSIGAVAVSRKIDVLALGERSAFHAGVDVRRLRLVTIIVAAVLTAAAVSFAGIISFVGLVVPHALRLAVGPRNRWLIPLSGIGGALLVCLADIASRNLLRGVDMPIGIFTAVVGAPTFFLLLRHSLNHGATR